VAFLGLPTCICWLGYGGRPVAELEFNPIVHDDELGAPIVLGREPLDCGSTDDLPPELRSTPASGTPISGIPPWPPQSAPTSNPPANAIG